MKPAPFPLLLFALACLAAQRSQAAPPETDLAKVPFFAFGGIGFAGTTSEGELAYKKILAGDDAEAAFAKTFERGNAAAKAYALHGLRALGSPRYAELKGRFLEEVREVKRMSGCIMSKDSAAKVIAFIEKTARP